MSRSRNTRKGTYGSNVVGCGDLFAIDPATGKPKGWRDTGGKDGKKYGKRFASKMRRRTMRQYDADEV